MDWQIPLFVLCIVFSFILVALRYCRNTSVPCGYEPIPTPPFSLFDDEDRETYESESERSWNAHLSELKREIMNRKLNLVPSDSADFVDDIEASPSSSRSFRSSQI